MGLQAAAITSEDGKERIINGQWTEVGWERSLFIDIFARIEEVDCEWNVSTFISNLRPFGLTTFVGLLIISLQIVDTIVQKLKATVVFPVPDIPVYHSTNTIWSIS